MRFFGRLMRHASHRVDVGTYVPPKNRTLAPVTAVVEEGVLISSYAVRLAIKNQLIVDALRDRADFDVEELKQSAHEHLLALADENDATAARLEARGEDQAPSRPGGTADEVTVTDTGDIVGRSKAIRLLDHRRRPEVHHRLADALRQRALEDDFLAAQVTEAQRAAWREVSGELVRRARGRRSYTPQDSADYARNRAERLRAFVDDDLAALRRAHPDDPGRGGDAEPPDPTK
ncbi:MAG TPA: hypothetical protein VFQ96_07730 [Microbacteriaceae bacterium]|nr:hypothetical protein [Microbacteriaceae bacterium]